MEKRACGNSGLELSLLGIGCWAFGGGTYWGPQDDRDAADVIARSLDAGVNYLDTAEGYNEGRSEETLGRLLKGRRHEAIIGTKVGPEHATPERLREHCQASLRRLQTDYIDIYMIHWPIVEHPVHDAFATLAALKAQGKIRAIGVSNFGVQQLSEAIEAGVPIAVDQLYYNMVSRGIEVEILPFCRRAGIGVMAYMPLQQGLLTGKYRSADEMAPARTRMRHYRGDRWGARHGEPGAEPELFAAVEGIRQVAARLGVPMAQLVLAWTKSRAGITCVLAGARTGQQVAENVAGAELVLPGDVLAELDRLTDPLLEKLGSNPDYFEARNRGRTR